ncbi:MAG: DUF2330 domain-containing protein [Aliidongia sp.]
MPTVVAEDDIRVVENNLIDKLDAYSAPRLTEYFDSDPCAPPVMFARNVFSPSMMAAAPPMAKSEATTLGVTIEARYQVGVYDILILSAKESDGLVTWLTDNNYKIPAGADAVLGSYIKQGMHFFVAKVNLDRQEQAGERFLRPLQVSYMTKKFMLPLRLGTVNAKGPQDMVVFILSRKGRVETTNYQTVKMASGIEVPLFAKDEFGAVYKAAYDKSVADDGMTKIYEEYAWDMHGYMPCDPCAAPVPDSTELFALGAPVALPGAAACRAGTAQDGQPSADAGRCLSDPVACPLHGRSLPGGSRFHRNRRPFVLPGRLQAEASVERRSSLHGRRRVSAQPAVTLPRRGRQPGPPDRMEYRRGARQNADRRPDLRAALTDYPIRGKSHARISEPLDAEHGARPRGGRHARRFDHAGLCLLRLLCGESRCEAVQQGVEGRAGLGCRPGDRYDGQ